MNINWQQTALNIRAHVPLEQATARLGKYKGWLNQIARGEITEPKFMDGINLLNLHLDLCGVEKHREIAREAC